MQFHYAENTSAQRATVSRVAEHSRPLAYVGYRPTSADDADEAQVSCKAAAIGVIGAGGHGSAVAGFAVRPGLRAAGFIEGGRRAGPFQDVPCWAPPCPHRLACTWQRCRNACNCGQ